MKTLANEIIPGDVFHPSEIIKDELEARGMRQVDLINQTGYNKGFISLLLKGERNITSSVALVLEKVFEIPAEFWIRLQKNYEMNKALIEIRNLKNAS
ncbi:MAG: addiction module antidote protein, HigA family [Bacteroidota bacterium]|jgi:HTH-type transcriptional regulator/antitoxin HigA|nr:addiction module antidote protein, HigA family [Bacteroidota bacterium]